MRNKNDDTLECLLELDGTKFVIDEQLGLWVKFAVSQVPRSKDRQHGIKYSLSLHNQYNKRIIGFDNAHAIEYGKKRGVAGKRTFDHWHRDHTDQGRPYKYVNAAKLLEDFWNEVNLWLERLKKSK